MDGHYNNLSSIYEESWSHIYKDENLIPEIVKKLSINEDDIIADFAGGTGKTSEMIINQTKSPIYCIDISREMIKIAATKKNIVAIPIDSELDFFNLNIKQVNKIFIKFAIHHFEHRNVFFSKLFQYFKDGSKGLIITRPKHPSYPFFKEAANKWYKDQIKIEDYTQSLLDSGFRNVNEEVISYPTTLKTSLWFDILRCRFSSNLNDFSDSEIEQGIKELEKTMTNDNFELIEKVVFITFEK
eukprot:gene10349-2763_t